MTEMTDVERVDRAMQLAFMMNSKGDLPSIGTSKMLKEISYMYDFLGNLVDGKLTREDVE